MYSVSIDQIKWSSQKQEEKNDNDPELCIREMTIWEHIQTVG